MRDQLDASPHTQASLQQTLASTLHFRTLPVTSPRWRGRLRPGLRPPRLRTIVHRLLAHLDPEGPQPADGGDTSVHNCCLLCPMHRHQVHLQGWDITIRGGHVEFRPPAIINPDRRPLTNPFRR